MHYYAYMYYHVFMIFHLVPLIFPILENYGKLETHSGTFFLPVISPLQAHINWSFPSSIAARSPCSVEAGQMQVLVATDVAARGLHVKHLSLDRAES